MFVSNREVIEDTLDRLLRGVIDLPEAADEILVLIERETDKVYFASPEPEG